MQEPPHVLGPVYLYWDGTYEAFHVLFSHLQCKIESPVYCHDRWVLCVRTAELHDIHQLFFWVENESWRVALQTYRVLHKVMLVSKKAPATDRMSFICTVCLHYFCVLGQFDVLTVLEGD